MQEYLIRRTSRVPLFRWEDFSSAETGSLPHLQEKTTDFAPKVRFRFLHDETNLYGIYEVEDRDVQAAARNFQDPVCRDSCCEFFFRPDVGPGYFNLEMSANGTFLIFYVKDPTRLPNDDLTDYTAVDPLFGKLITVKTDLPGYFPEPIPGPLTWHVMCTIPLAALEPYCGAIGSLNRRLWKGNFFKCGDRTPHPAWLSWSRIEATPLNFHLPQFFQSIRLE